MLCALCFTLLFVGGSRQLSISDFAVPAALPAGESAELQCRYHLDPGETDRGLFVKWWWTPWDAGTEQKKQLYQRMVGHDPQLVHANDNPKREIKENDTIVLLKLEPKFSGTYECEVFSKEEARRQQQLIIFTQGSGPQLNASLVADGPDEDTEEDVLVTCEASEVAPRPQLSINIEGELAEPCEMFVSEPVDGLYNITGNATFTQYQVDGVKIICELFFENANISHPAYTGELEYIGSSSTTTETTELITETEHRNVTDTVQTPDGSNKLDYSWIFLASAAILSSFS